MLINTVIKHYFTSLECRCCLAIHLLISMGFTENDFRIFGDNFVSSKVKSDGQIT